MTNTLERIDVASEELAGVEEPLCELPEILKYQTKPFYRTGDGVKNGNHVWLFQAGGKFEQEFVDLANYALNAAIKIREQSEPQKPLNKGNTK